MRRVQEGFDFVKYRYKQKYDGSIHRTPAINSFRRYEHRVAEIFCKYDDPVTQMEKIDKYTAHWLKAFPHWHTNEFSMLNFEMNKQSGIFMGEDKLAANKPQSVKQFSKMTLKGTENV